MAHNTPAEEVRAVERQRFAALGRGDISALSNILSDDLTYTHSNGVFDSKVELLNKLQSGALKYEVFEPEEIAVRVYGNTAVLTGIAHGKAWANGTPNTFRLRYTDMYVLTGNAWRMVAWQSTRIA